MTFEEFIFTDRLTFEDRVTATYKGLTFQSYGGIMERVIRVFDTNTHQHSTILIYPSIEHCNYRFRIDINGNFAEKIEKLTEDYWYKFYNTGDRMYVVSKASIIEIFKKIFALRNFGLK